MWRQRGNLALSPQRMQSQTIAPVVLYFTLHVENGVISFSFFHFLSVPDILIELFSIPQSILQ